MVIVCPECTTKFRVNPERIPERGAKVRCARCKHVFLAEKTQTQAAPTVLPVAPDQNRATENRVEAAVTATRGPADRDQPKFKYEEPEAVTESDFDYNSFREQDNLPKEEPFIFSSDNSAADSHETAEQVFQPLNEKESFSFGEADDEQANTRTNSFSFTEQSAVNSAATTNEEPAAPRETTQKAKGGALSSIIRIILLLILGLLIVGGVLLYMNGPEQLEQLRQQLFGQQNEQASGSGQIVLQDLQGKFILNQDVGELFAIRGEAVNKFKETRASIQVKGVIFDQNGKPLLQKTVFCGNPISDQELQALPFSKIEELMGNQFGKSLSNMNVNKDQAIPFVIVFRDLPPNLAEFSADVTASKPATP